MPRKSQLTCYFGCIVDGPMHRFPKWEYHQEKFNAWKATLGPIEESNQYIYNNIRFCYRHFENNFKLPSRQLTRNAVPTLNLSKQVISNDEDTAGRLSDDKIMNSAVKTETTDLDDIEDSNNTTFTAWVSIKEAKTAINTLRNFIEQTSYSEEQEFSALNILEKAIDRNNRIT